MGVLAITMGSFVLLACTWQQVWLIKVMAGTQKSVNQLFYQSVSGKLSFNLCGPNVYFDTLTQGGNIPFLYSYWCPGTPIKWAAPTELDRVARETGLTQHSFYLLTDKGAPHGCERVAGEERYAVFLCQAEKNYVAF